MKAGQNNKYDITYKGLKSFADLVTNLACIIIKIMRNIKKYPK